MQDTAGSTTDNDIALPATTPADEAPASESPFGTPTEEQPPVSEAVETPAPAPAPEASASWVADVFAFGLLVLLALAIFRIFRDREALNVARRETREARVEARRARDELTRVETAAETAPAPRDPDPEPAERAARLKLEKRMRAVLTMSQKLRKERDELARANSRLKDLVMSDPLTGLMNAGRFTEQLESELRRALRVGKPLTLFICDIDAFRGFNETHGVERGDLLLQRIASQIESLFRRGGDVVARLGPDRFGILAPETNYLAALEYAETFRREVEDRDYGDELSDVPELATVSMGITEVNPDQPRTTREVLERTALTLQLAKRKGGNRVLGTRLRQSKGATTETDAAGARAATPKKKRSKKKRSKKTSARTGVRAKAAEGK